MTDVLIASWPVMGIMVLLLGASAVFSSAETAVFSLGWSDLRRMQAGRAVRTLEQLLHRRRRLLATVLLANLVINVLYFNLGALVSYRFLAAGYTTGAMLTPILVLAGIVLFGEILPKTVAVKWPRPVARFFALPLYWTQRLLWLPRIVLASIAAAAGRLLIGSREEEGEVGPEELRALLQLAAEEGHLAADEHEWLQSVLILSEIEVREIMVPRVNVVAFSLDQTREDLIELAARHRHNKYPVSRESLDTVEGFIDVKEVLAHPERSLEELVHPVSFVPETATVSDVLARFLEARVRLLVVVDEYGGAEGLVTHEDLVEAVVGDLGDEHEEEAAVREIGPGAFEVDAGIGIRRMARLLGRPDMDLSVKTMGGLVTLLLERLPKPGDLVQAGRVSIEVLSVKRRRCEWLLVSLRPGRATRRPSP